MKVYTKTGDDGTTGIVGNVRLRKDDPRIEAIGSVDEANAAIGVCRALGVDADLDEILSSAQSTLFDIGAAFATPADRTERPTLVEEVDVQKLERSIDSLSESLPPLRNFILPGGSEAAARLHWARVCCRRAERAAITLASQDEVPTVPLVYLNRLSDWLFVAARTANARADVEDVPWIGRKRKER